MELFLQIISFWILVFMSMVTRIFDQTFFVQLKHLQKGLWKFIFENDIFVRFMYSIFHVGPTLSWADLAEDSSM